MAPNLTQKPYPTYTLLPSLDGDGDGYQIVRSLKIEAPMEG